MAPNLAPGTNFISVPPLSDGYGLSRSVVGILNQQGPQGPVAYLGIFRSNGVHGYHSIVASKLS